MPDSSNPSTGGTESPETSEASFSIPGQQSQDAEPDFSHDRQQLAHVSAPPGELFNLRVLPGIEREKDEREDLLSDNDAAECNPAITKKSITAKYVPRSGFAFETMSISRYR